MSMTARHENRKSRQTCQRCRDRRARFQYRGQVRADRDHSPSLPELRRASTLCFECYRSEGERQRAHKLSPLQAPMLWSPLGARPPLSEHELAHRRLMLDHLRRQSADESRVS
jgi:hypothetical protein